MSYLFTYFPNYQAAHKQEAQADSVGEIAWSFNNISAEAKDKLPWIKLCTFGDDKTDKGSLRHDANVTSVTGIEADYDDGVVSPEAALAALQRHGIEAVVYASPSYTKDVPRFRVLAFFSEPYQGTRNQMKSYRDQMLLRLERACGIKFARESYTLSQSYYFGWVGKPLIWSTAGSNIDEADDLDTLEAPQSNVSSISKHQPGQPLKAFETQEEALGAFLTGEAIHPGAASITMSMAAKGAAADEIRQYFEGLRDTVEGSGRKDVSRRLDGFYNRGELDSLIESAISKAEQYEEADFDVEASEPEPEQSKHPYLRYVTQADTNKASTFLIDGVLTDQFSVFGAYPGTGKTTVAISLYAVVCGAYSNPDLNIDHWRHVVYVTEHYQQVGNIITAMVQDGVVTPAIWERFHICPAVRLKAPSIVTAAKPLIERFSIPVTRNGITVDFLPAVVMDTTSATISVDDENSNTAWSEAIATLRQRFLGIPVQLVAHTAKQHKRGKAEEITIRGASSIEGDVAQVLLLSQDDTGTRYLEVAIPKHRFEPKVYAFQIESHICEVWLSNQWDEPVTQDIRYCTLIAMDEEERQEAMDAAEAQAAQTKRERVEAGKQETRETIEARITEFLRANPESTKTHIVSEVQGKKDTKRSVLYEMEERGDLVPGETKYGWVLKPPF